MMDDTFSYHLRELDDVHIRIGNSISNLNYMVEAMSARDLDGAIESGLCCVIDYLTIQHERMCREIDDLHQLLGNSDKTI